MAGELHSNKDRIVAVDLLRLMAAFFVMYRNIYAMGVLEPGGMMLARQFTSLLVLPVPVFFLFAGFFACRNITWKKALNNAWWAFAPYMLWNGITLLLCYLYKPELLEGRGFCDLFGFGDLACLGGGMHWIGSMPVNIAMWFMRDLIFLFLLSPILAKLAKYLFPAFLFFSIIPITSKYMISDSEVFMSWGTVAFFSFGCYLSNFSKETKHRIMTYTSPRWLVIYLVVTMIVFYLNTFLKVLPFADGRNFVHNLIAICLLYQFGRWVEVRFPRVREFAVKFAPVTFLTFACHNIFYIFLPTQVYGTYIVALVPVLCFVFCSIFFFTLKRWCRPLLHLVAHYKLRLEDVAPKPHADAPAVNAKG